MRARNIKPGFFTNEELAVADPIYGHIFSGLWCMADRSGRLEDRPAKIHMSVNPGRAFETTERSLNWLTDHNFIQRYEADGRRLIQVLQFLKHQNPHHKEPPSSLPGPNKNPGFDPHASTQNPGLELHASGIHEDKASENQSRMRHARGQNPADSGFLIPDSGSRIPEAKASLSARATQSSFANPIHDWRRTPGLNHEAFNAWIAYLEQANKQVSPATAVSMAKVLAATGDGAHQTELIAHHVRSGWKNIRNVDLAAEKAGPGGKHKTKFERGKEALGETHDVGFG